ncbi:MAG: hypothetical protein KF833_08585 [Verrucomicrobiae bacterium]|nr:hypothetical protein [Verrucomicrobiae bacterium]
MSSSNKPAHEVRLGAVKATIWRNEHESGVRFNTVLSKIYREGEQWKNTDNFGREDLLLVAKVADAAHTWIYAQNREGTGQGGSGGAGGGAGGGSAGGSGRSGGMGGGMRSR